MKFFFSLIIMCFIGFPSSGWLSNIQEAKKEALRENKLILLNFSGSDWCGPCMRMRREIFESTAFTKLAATKLVLINADFPRMKKNQLTKDQQKANDQLAEQYNPKGIFPYTLLLTAEGSVLKSWEGFYQGGADEFTNQVSLFVK